MNPFIEINKRLDLRQRELQGLRYRLQLRVEIFITRPYGINIPRSTTALLASQIAIMASDHISLAVIPQSGSDALSSIYTAAVAELNPDLRTPARSQALPAQGLRSL